MKAHRNGKPDRQAMTTAYHEAGHAVMSIEVGRPPKRASVVPDAAAGSLGHVLSHHRPTTNVAIEWGGHDAWEKAVPELLVLVSGPVAERMYTGRRNNTGARSDHEEVNDILGRVCGGWEEARALFRWVESRAAHTLTTPSTWAAVRSVAGELSACGTLSGKAVKALWVEAYNLGPHVEEAAQHLRHLGYATDGRVRWSDGLRLDAPKRRGKR